MRSCHRRESGWASPWSQRDSCAAPRQGVVMPTWPSIPYVWVPYGIPFPAEEAVVRARDLPAYFTARQGAPEYLSCGVLHSGRHMGGAQGVYRTVRRSVGGGPTLWEALPKLAHLCDETVRTRPHKCCLVEHVSVAVMGGATRSRYAGASPSAKGRHGGSHGSL